MYNFLAKNGQVVAFGLGVVLIGIFLLMSVPQAGGYYFETMSDEEIYKVDIFNFGIRAAIALAVLCAAAMLLFGLYHIATNPKGSIKGIIGVAVLVILFFILYSSTSGEPDHPTIVGAVEKYEDSAEGRVITPGNLKFIGAATSTMLLMIGLAFAALVVTGIRNLFK